MSDRWRWQRALASRHIEQIGTAATILYLKAVTFARSLASSLPLRGRSVNVLAVPKAAVQMFRDRLRSLSSSQSSSACESTTATTNGLGISKVFR
jgi:hypothetical protein